ncbi:MAG: TSUP family transporter, partial [Clostridia bacterium]|nr:TSUP family transporter [Clostridia bacterium]
MGLIYFLIVFIATTAGAVAGVGGGVIIKPALDAIGQYDVETIGILASSAVFSMAVVATIRQWIRGLSIDIKILMLSIGSIVGGILGKELLYSLTGSIESEIVKLIQAIIIIVLMIMI